MWYCYIVVDEVKDVLAETSLSNNLIQIIQVNQGKLDPESQQLIKMASDLLILLLTGGRELTTIERRVSNNDISNTM